MLDVPLPGLVQWLVKLVLLHRSSCQSGSEGDRSLLRVSMHPLFHHQGSAPRLPTLQSTSCPSFVSSSLPPYFHLAACRLNFFIPLRPRLFRLTCRFRWRLSTRPEGGAPCCVSFAKAFPVVQVVKSQLHTLVHPVCSSWLKCRRGLVKNKANPKWFSMFKGCHL